MQDFFRNRYNVLVIGILLLSIFLRFFHYGDRWGLAYDQAHDGIIAKYALDTFQLPLLGPFSSAGPYQTGGEWYWFIMAGTLLVPFSVVSPWICMTLLYVLFVFLIILVAKELVNKEFGLIAGLLAAVSPAQITQGTNLTNQSPMAVIALLSIWCSVRYIRHKHRKHIFLLALLVGLGSSIHLQGVALGLLFLVTFFTARRFDVKTIVTALTGLIIPWLPVLIVDVQHDFFNVRGMLQYYLHDQYAISLDVLGRRWKTYAGVFWPTMWGFVIGGSVFVGYAFITSLLVLGGYTISKKKISKEWTVLTLSMIAMITLLRYTRTPLFESYIVFLHPFILLISTYVIYWLYQQKRIMGYSVLLVIVIMSLLRDVKEISGASNRTGRLSAVWKEHLITQYPGKSFTIYDYKNDTKDKSLPLLLFLHSYNRKLQDSMKIGMIATDEAFIKLPIIYGRHEGTKIVNLESVPVSQLEKEGWVHIDSKAIYDSTEFWYTKK